MLLASSAIRTSIQCVLKRESVSHQSIRPTLSPAGFHQFIEYELGTLLLHRFQKIITLCSCCLSSSLPHAYLALALDGHFCNALKHVDALTHLRTFVPSHLESGIRYLFMLRHGFHAGSTCTLWDETWQFAIAVYTVLNCRAGDVGI